MAEPTYELREGIDFERGRDCYSTLLLFESPDDGGVLTKSTWGNYQKIVAYFKSASSRRYFERGNPFVLNVHGERIRDSNVRQKLIKAGISESRQNKIANLIRRIERVVCFGELACVTYVRMIKLSVITKAKTVILCPYIGDQGLVNFRPKGEKIENIQEDKLRAIASFLSRYIEELGCFGWESLLKMLNVPKAWCVDKRFTDGPAWMLAKSLDDHDILRA